MALDDRVIDEFIRAWNALMAALGVTSLRITPRPDGKLDTEFPAGDGPPDEADLAVDTTAFVAAPAITGLQTGTPFTHNYRQYLTGTDAAGATLAVTTVSGDDATTEGWAISGDDVTHDGGETGAGVLQVTATASGSTVAFPAQPWSYISPPAGADTVAPTIPTGLTLTEQANGDVLAEIDCPSDPSVSGATWSGVERIDLHRTPPGSIVKTAALSLGAPFQFTTYQVGAYSPAPSVVQTGADHALTSAGLRIGGGTSGGIIDDRFLFRAVQVTGDFVATCKISSFVNANSTVSPVGLMAREGVTDVDDRYFMAKKYPDAGGVGTQANWRLDKGAYTGNGTIVAAVNCPIWQRLTRSGDDFSYDYSLDGVTWSPTSTKTISMPQTLYVGAAFSSNSDGNEITVTIEQLGISQTGRVQILDDTTSPGTAYTYKARCADAAGTENVSAYSATKSITTESVAPPAGLLLIDNFEGSVIDAANFGIPGGQLGGTETRLISTDYARHGSKSVKFYNPFQGIGADPHCELAVKVDAGKGNPLNLGDERWIGFSVYVPSPWVAHTHLNWDEYLFQIHSSDRVQPSGSNDGDTLLNPPFGFRIELNRWALHAWARSTVYTPSGEEGTTSTGGKDLGPVVPGIWQDVVIHTLWHYSTGYLKFWTKRASQLWPGQSSVNDPVNSSDAAGNAWIDLAQTKNFFSKTSGIGYNRAPADPRGTIKFGHYPPSWRVNGINNGITERTYYHDMWRIADGSGSFASVDPARAP